MIHLQRISLADESTMSLRATYVERALVTPQTNMHSQAGYSKSTHA